MTRTLLLIAALAAPLSTLALPAQAQDTPMVWAFHQFCADENFTLDKARLAIQAAGGMPHEPARAIPLAANVSVTFWDIVKDGHKIEIGLTDMRATAGTVSDLVTCQVIADGSDDAGIAALRQWAGVAPDSRFMPNIEIYRFLVEGGKPMPAPAISADRTVEDRVWALNLMTGRGMVDKRASAILTRRLKAADRADPHAPR